MGGGPGGPGGGFRGPPRPGEVLSPPVVQQLQLTAAQVKQLAELQKETDAQLDKLMTEEQRKLWGIEQLNVPRSDIPAVTHIDYSARVQTVDKDVSPNYHALIKAFERLTGCAVLINTSFNVRGEPIVCSPADAYRCFMRTHIDVLVLYPFILEKAKQPDWKETGEWQKEFQLD